MAGGVDGQPGGILRVAGELSEHRAAIEYDLITLGLRLDDLGTESLSWRDLLVILQNLPRTSAYARDTLGDDVMWGLGEQLLAIVADRLDVANWQRGNEGRKSPSPRPKLIPRPGVRDSKSKIGSDPIKIRDFDAWWDGEPTVREPSSSQPETPDLSGHPDRGGWRGELLPQLQKLEPE